MSVRNLTKSQLLEEILSWSRGDKKPLSIHANAIQLTSKKDYLNRFYLDSGFENVYFTKREMEVAVLLLESVTYEYIAKHLNLSERTIECYIKHMKLKLACSNKKKLMNCIRKIDAVKHYRDQA